MYLFTRASRLGSGHLAESMDWSVRLTAKVNTVAEVDVSLWTTVFSPGLLTLTWTASIENLTQMSGLNDKLLADGGYVELVDEGAQFSSGEAIDDSLMRFVHADPDGASGTAQVATVVQGVLAPGQSVSGVALGVEIAQRAKAITGCPTSFGTSVTGTYGGVGWITTFDSMDQAQAADEALATDADFAALLDAKASVAYLPGATRTIHRKIV